jgi:pimeloyl-ACP methyl ester carboxylesterase
MNLRLFGFIAAFALVLTGVLVAGSSAPTPAAADGEPTLPIVFVHGGAGSGAQYEVQAQRFASNGYPNVIRGIDRTSSYPPTLYPMLDEYFDAVMAETGDDQIYVAAHSYGTSMMVGYLNSSPERSARVAKYINIDGAKGEFCPGNPEPVPCINISQWGSLGPINYNFPEFQHTQCVTAAESFAHQYEFLTGEEPETLLVLPEPPGQVDIGGRVILFPANTVPEEATLEIWEVHGNSGVRKDTAPMAVIEIGEDGNFGPINVNGMKHYEFSLYRPESGLTVHYYFQPFIRDDLLIRLLVTPPDSAILENTPRGPDHAAYVILRYFDYLTGAESENDELWVTTRSPAWDDDPVNPTPPTLNILSEPNIAPRANKLALHVHDLGIDKVSTLLRSDFFYTQPFQTGVDIWMPATDPPDGTITFTNVPGKFPMFPQTINTANWSSDNHRVLVMFNAYFQEINSWPECVQADPSPCN